MSKQSKEGLGVARLLMVLSSLSPLFILWAVRGIESVSDGWLTTVCCFMVIVPNLILVERIRVANKNSDRKTLTIGEATDNSEHLLVYLFAVLMPLYGANLGCWRDFAATVIAFLFVITLFMYMNLHYMNFAFALFGYKVFTVKPSASDDGISGQNNFVLLTKRSYLKEGEQISALRISNTVFIER